MKLGLLVIALAIVAIGCSVGTSSTASPNGSSTTTLTSAPSVVPETSVAFTAAPVGPPVDPSVAPVSRSHPSVDAQQALTVCQVVTIGIDKITGMGLISAANRAPEYAPLTGLEPEIASDASAWMVQFSGEVPQPMSGETWIDPVCVVISGYGGFNATGPVILKSGELWTPAPGNTPRYALPPLAP